MVVTADEVLNVMVSHDAAYRRGPEQNAPTRQTSSGHDAEREVGRNRVTWTTFRPVLAAD